ncbi:type IV / VI secretion system protein [Halarcobacter ebronensis]|uniref:Type IV / VI secretion system protein n=1 Tax=Halarcobacter ebronensis TaxID=1462615 RepID=A0A4Q0YB90_9BACT|nr:type IVB secretion system protein IcmH/DotU [Halarcobacter ebronensis]RXJ67323.1 type IV / VI secretion system protein [Halarcobacter ebronensis]
MSNKTILITNENNRSNSLTNFSRVDMPPHDNFKKQTSTFRRNNLKNRFNEFDISFNPFISSASPIITYALEVCEFPSENIDMDEVRENCISKINHYSETALKYGIENTEVLVTRYIICTFVDELMNINYSTTQNSWSSNSLLNIFHRETYGGENFFHLLDKFLKTSAKYIHILELMYICLALGFEGKYRVRSRGEVELSNIKESLFRQIKMVQGKDPFTFYTIQEPSKDKYRLFNKVPYSLLFLGVLLFVSVIYSIFTYALNEQNSDFMNFVDNKKIVIETLEGTK